MYNSYADRPVRNADDVAFIFAADFARVCERSGDHANASRWRNVIWQERVRRGIAGCRLVKSVAPKQHQHSLPLM